MACFGVFWQVGKMEPIAILPGEQNAGDVSSGTDDHDQALDLVRAFVLDLFDADDLPAGERWRALTAALALLDGAGLPACG